MQHLFGFVLNSVITEWQTPRGTGLCFITQNNLMQNLERFAVPIRFIALSKVSIASSDWLHVYRADWLITVYEIWWMTSPTGSTGDPEGSAEVREGRLHAHGCQRDGLCGRARFIGWQEHIGSYLAGDAKPCHSQGMTQWLCIHGHNQNLNI